MAVPGIEIYSNNTATTLASGISSSATSLTVLSGTGAEFPEPTTGQFFRFTLNDVLTGLVYEVIYATARSGDTFSGLIRGQDGTTAVAWLSGDKVFVGVTAGAMSNLGQQQQIQQNTFNYAPDSGSANAYAITLAPATLQTPVPGAVIHWTAANANTGASTVTVNGGSTYPLLGAGRTDLQGGEIVKFCSMTFDAALSSYILLESAGGALQGPSSVSGSNQYMTLGQAESDFAQINGSGTEAFAASELVTPVVQTPSNTNPLLLESATYVAAVNKSDSAYVPIFAAAATIGNPQAVTILSQFALTASTPGYMQFPGGFILQWGSVNLGTAPAQVISLPIAFPNNFLGCVASYGDTPPASGSCGAVPFTKTQIALGNSASTVNQVWWLAWGN